MAATGVTTRLNEAQAQEFTIPSHLIKREFRPKKYVSDMSIGDVGFLSDEGVIVDNLSRCWLKLGAEVNGLGDWKLKVIRSPSGYKIYLASENFKFAVDRSFDIEENRELYVPIKKIIPFSLMLENPRLWFERNF